MLRKEPEHWSSATQSQKGGAHHIYWNSYALNVVYDMYLLKEKEAEGENVNITKKH